MCLLFSNSSDLNNVVPSKGLLFACGGACSLQKLCSNPTADDDYLILFHLQELEKQHANFIREFE